MARAFLLVLDSFGIGGAADAGLYGDEGSNTLGSIARVCQNESAATMPGRKGPLKLPHMNALGLCHAAVLASGTIPPGMPLPEIVLGAYGAASEISRGKDTPSGHWEMAGTPVLFDWGYFPKGGQAFPTPLVDAMCHEGRVTGILGNCHASGTQVIAEWGLEHIRSGKPICYTSTDSVLQIAAHETHFGLERLLAFCQVVRRLVDPLKIGRVIARPFKGESPETFVRTGNRRDFSVLPPEPTLLDRLVSAGHQVHAIGKIGDIFAHQGISTLTKAHGNMALFDETLAAFETARDGDLVFTNFVDFDMLYGHRRDAAGYACALEAFDQRLPELFARLRQGDLVILTADHGCDPTWPGTDHTRERIPVLAFGHGIKAGSIGILETFADIGETIAAHLGIAPGVHGLSFL